MPIDIGRLLDRLGRVNVYRVSNVSSMPSLSSLIHSQMNKVNTYMLHLFIKLLHLNKSPSSVNHHLYPLDRIHRNYNTNLPVVP